MQRAEPSLRSESISASRQGWFVVRLLTGSEVPLDPSQLLSRKVVPGQGNQGEKPSAVLSHLRLLCPPGTSASGKKGRVWEAFLFHLVSIFPILFRQQPDNTDNQSDLCSPLRCVWIFGEMQMEKKEVCPHLSSDTFYENLNQRPGGILCSYHLTTLRLP